MTFTRNMIRLAAVVIAFALSGSQFRFFDCNKVRGLSILSGVITLLIIYATGEFLYNSITSGRSTRDKLIRGTLVVFVGAGFVALGGFLVLISHLCP